MTLNLNVEYLREILNTRGWSERQFALKTGLSSSTVSRILNKKRGVGAKTLLAIREALKDIPLEKLFFIN
ncbi:MAG: helix-turn-helix transcriptional regulator [Firmicutes bacterium]|nr:helix-turn-helix transcriptional regulator [Bacillota bacterium]